MDEFVNLIDYRSTRYETGRWDSPIEGFVFRIWIWDDPLDTFTSGKSMNSPAPTKFILTPVKTTETPPEDTNESDFAQNVQDNNNYSSDEEESRNQGSPYEWISNMVPFGHPNLNGRHLLSLR